MTKSSISNKWSEVHFKNSIFEAAHLCVWLQTEWHLVLQLKGMLIKMCHCPKTQKAVNAVMVQWIINSGITSLYAKVSDFLHCSFLFFLFSFYQFVVYTNYRPQKLNRTNEEDCARDLCRGQVQWYIYVVTSPTVLAINEGCEFLYVPLILQKLSLKSWTMSV